MKPEKAIPLVIAVSIITSTLTVGALRFLPSITPHVPATTEPAPEETFTPSSGHEQTVTDVVAGASSAVVSVVATKDLPVIERYFENPFPFSPFFEVPRERQNGTERREVAAGTGFVVDASGVILTNRHVVDVEGAGFTVVFPSGDKKPATILAIDPVEDLAVLKVEAAGLPVIPLGNSDEIRVGQTAIAIGNALGQFHNTVSVGVVSGLARKIEAGGAIPGESEIIENAIQTDAAINEGNSGGPLLDLSGRAIGINTAIVQGSQNIGFAIPINKAKRALESVKATGKITYPFLGVRYVLVTKEIQEARKLSVDRGALVLGSDDGKQPGVIPDSPAAKAGLREGDVILTVNGKEVNEQHTLSALVQQYKIGDTVTLTILSGSETKTVQATLAERTS